MARKPSLRAAAASLTTLALGLSGALLLGPAATAAPDPGPAPGTSPGTSEAPDAAAAVADAVANLPELTFDDPSIAWSQILVDGDDVERDADGNPYNVFGGFGSVSCNNTSNLLLDYKEENPDAYWRIMNLLFNPETGAGLKHIKVELGADNNTSSGTEPATKRSADEPANVLRGAGFHFIADALSINPDIETEALRWGEPSWTQGNLDLRYQWYKETIDAAYDTYGVTFDYLSPSQNEVHANYITSELAWTVDFAQRLEVDALASDARYDYGQIKIVALDSYRNVGAVSRAILASPAALEQVDAVGYHYDIAGDPDLTRLNKEFGMEVLYSEGVSPMIEPEYRINGQPAMGGIGGTVGAVDIADRFINAYRWEGSNPNPGHMTTFLFQPAVSAMYEGTQYQPKSLVRASDPWSGFYEGGVGIALVRHFMQFIDEGWEYVEGASLGNGSKGDGGTVVNTSTRTYLTLRTPQALVETGDDLELTQVHANNTATTRSFEVKVADAGETGRPLFVWETTGPDVAGVADIDENWFQNTGYVEPVRTEVIGGVTHDVYRVQIAPYSIQTISSLPDGVHGSAESYVPGDFATQAADEILALPYTDDYSYADYPTASINGVEMDYVERRGGSPRYTADQNGAFEVLDSGDPARGNVMVQRNHADNRGYTWNVWGDGSQRNVSTDSPATVLGDHRWTSYTASIDFKLDEVVRNAALPNFAGLGVRQVLPAGADLATYATRVFDDGRWELRKLGAVVASGQVFMFDPSSWHTLEVEARENVITATLDGTVLGTYADSSSNPVMAGRISIVSGHYNTAYDNLAITPIDGISWESEKVDDADARITYPTGASYAQAGYAHFNRTQHVLTASRSFALDFTGTGLNLFGATAAATLDIAVDADPVRRVSVGGVGDRQTSAWLRGLADGDHTVTVTVVSGTFTLDGVDVVQGGDSPAEVDPALKPIAVATPVPRLATEVGTAPALPATVRATSQAGGVIDAPVTWTLVPSAFTTPYALAKVDGTFTNNPALTVSAYVEVVPDGVRYFIDANAPAVPAASAHPAVKAFVEGQGETLLNATADGAWSVAAGWGRGATYSAKGLLNQTPYDKMRETGWYTANATTPLTYRLTLPAGEYEVASGHTEWWASGGNRNMTMTIEVPNGTGGTSVVPVGAVSFPSTANGQRATVGAAFTMPVAGEVVYRVANNGGNQAMALSWLAVNVKQAPAQVVDRAALQSLLAQAQASPRKAYTADSWSALRTVGTAAHAVEADPQATQQEVDDAAAALTTALAALVEVAHLPVADYRVATPEGQLPVLPATVALATLSGMEQQVPVTWAPVAASAFTTPYSTVAVTGSTGATAITLQVEVVPEGLTYFVDAAAAPGLGVDNAGVTSPSHTAVAALLGDQLRNAVPDRRFPATGQELWGLTSPIDAGTAYVGAKARVAGTYDKFTTTGWYAAGTNGSVGYRFWLEEGTYEVTSGYREWWGQTRSIIPSVTVDGVRTDGTGVTLSAAAPQAVSTVTVVVDEAGYADFGARLGTGSQLPVLSWVAVDDVTPEVQPVVLEGIAVTTPPTNVDLLQGAVLDVTGLVVTATFSDGSTSVLDVASLAVSGYDAAVLGEQVVTVTATIGEVSRSATFTVRVAAPVPSFVDVPFTAQFSAEIEWLAAEGVSTGWALPGGGREYRPVQPIARDAMAVFLFRLAGDPAYTAPTVSPFVDVATTNPFYREITWLASTGISTGWPTAAGAEFRPYSPIARDAMAAFLYRLADRPAFSAPAVSTFGDVGTGNQFYKEISWLASEGISTGWPGQGGAPASYQPLSAVNRDAMAAFLFRFSHR